MVRTNFLIQLRSAKLLAWFAIFCLVSGWTHVELHALGQAGSGHEHFGSHASDETERGHHHGVFFVSDGSGGDHENSAPGPEGTTYGDQCLLADHPPTTLCLGAATLGRFELVLARQVMPDDVKSDNHSSVFPIRAPPFA